MAREVADLTPELYERDLLLTWELSLSEIRAVLAATRFFRIARDRNVDCRVFPGGLGVSIFRDKSTRTRYSYAAALDLLGLAEYAIDESTSQIAHGETVRETATMLGFLTQVVGIRDDMYLGRGDTYMREVSRAITDSHAAGILPTRPSVINLQSDVDHPTQTLADLAQLTQRFGGLDALRGRTLAVTWAYSPSYGKPMSVPQGLIGLATRLGMQVRLAYPEGYELLNDVVDLGARQAKESGGSLTVGRDMDEAFSDADIVYPKSWAPLGVMQHRTHLVEAGDEKGLADLERQCLESNALHLDWECDSRRMAMTHDALYMHCLPADITGVSCDRGEVSAEVFENHLRDTYRQAGFKPYVIAGVIALTRFARSAETLQSIADREQP